MEIELKSVDVVLGHENCMTCDCYEQCANDIINHPEWVVKCIHFGFLQKYIEEIMSKEN